MTMERSARQEKMTVGLSVSNPNLTGTMGGSPLHEPAGFLRHSRRVIADFGSSTSKIGFITLEILLRFSQ